MSDEEPNEGGSPASATTGTAKKRKILLAAIVAGIVATTGGTAAYMFLGHDTQPEVPLPLVYVDLPPVTVNLNAADGRSRFLKVRVTLAVEDEAAAELVRTRMAAILDPQIAFLRELRPEDLAGSQATFRIKEELLIRASQAIAPMPVNDVLIQELVQQ